MNQQEEIKGLAVQELYDIIEDELRKWRPYLSDWRLDIQIVEEDNFIKASVWYLEEFHNAIIRFNIKQLRDKTEDYIRRVVQHELLHIVLRPLIKMIKHDDDAYEINTTIHSIINRLVAMINCDKK